MKGSRHIESTTIGELVMVNLRPTMISHFGGCEGLGGYRRGWDARSFVELRPSPRKRGNYSCGGDDQPSSAKASSTVSVCKVSGCQISIADAFSRIQPPGEHPTDTGEPGIWESRRWSRRFVSLLNRLARAPLISTTPTAPVSGGATSTRNTCVARYAY
ncbi:hypothetical protein M404DRAFT_180650 [Pisolithus tinctorius Marx 270]|uniref:Uncharacterized protein n=1 Tax=Pisolithus tinctorius Marx 270 TaxID=870435 RepID=A0A0C3PZ65_PISTI|nr:hypothetical protein M404DRAFT_180650 [Pisolithus tinctorius Marx 270]